VVGSEFRWLPDIFWYISKSEFGFIETSLFDEGNEELSLDLDTFNFLFQSSSLVFNAAAILNGFLDVEPGLFSSGFLILDVAGSVRLEREIFP